MRIDRTIERDTFVYVRLHYESGSITLVYITSRDRDRNNDNGLGARTPKISGYKRTTVRGESWKLQPHRMAKLPLEPQSHDEHEESHAGGGGQERRSRDEHARRAR